jgi:hypothetical protein
MPPIHGPLTRDKPRFAMSAVSCETGEMVLVFWLKARTEDAARKAATARLANGTGYLPETATVRAV